MLIRNKAKLATNVLRRDALDIIEAGLLALDTKKAIYKNLEIKKNFLVIKGRHYDLARYRDVYLLSFGKDALEAAAAVSEILGNRLKKGVVLSQKSGKLPKIEVWRCSHPNPSVLNAKATVSAIDLIKATTEEDLLIVVASGGGSSMLTAPYKINVREKASISQLLMNSGADIWELNTVRKHLSEIKGGRLSALAYPATVAVLVFSDVAGNDLSTIASGPTVMDHTTNEDAKKVLDKYKILEKLKLSEVALNETPKEAKYFHKTEHFVLVDNSQAVIAMENSARKLGYESKIYSTNLKGDAREVGKILLQASGNKQALIAAGETTVKVRGKGQGGRCQEMVLANLQVLKVNQILLAMGSDGHDNSDFAGALGDKETLKKAQDKKVKPETFLEKSDSFNFFRQVGDGIDTGKLESNAADLMLVLTGKS